MSYNLSGMKRRCLRLYPASQQRRYRDTWSPLLTPHRVSSSITAAPARPLRSSCLETPLISRLLTSFLSLRLLLSLLHLHPCRHSPSLPRTVHVNLQSGRPAGASLPCLPQRLQDCAIAPLLNEGGIVMTNNSSGEGEHLM